MSSFLKALFLSSVLVLSSCAHHNCAHKTEGCNECKECKDCKGGQCEMKHAQEEKK